jgi:hypothetical protein
MIRQRWLAKKCKFIYAAGMVAPDDNGKAIEDVQLVLNASCCAVHVVMLLLQPGAPMMACPVAAPLQDPRPHLLLIRGVVNSVTSIHSVCMCPLPVTMAVVTDIT